LDPGPPQLDVISLAEERKLTATTDVDGTSLLEYLAYHRRAR
jgi:hypothetical protein